MPFLAGPCLERPSFAAAGPRFFVLHPAGLRGVPFGPIRPAHLLFLGLIAEGAERGREFEETASRARLPTPFYSFYSFYSPFRNSS
jgi:hypothetical protein